MSPKLKILSIDKLTSTVTEIRKTGKTVVHCHGVFDLLHIGHIRYFEQAARMGDLLIVTVTPDQYVDKGPHRPAFTEALRAEAIASLDYVDFVAVNEWPTAEETLRQLKPDIYVKGSEFKNLADDMTGKIGKEAEVVAEIGAKIAFTEDIVFSSSNLINRYMSNLPHEISQYLDIFRQRYQLDEILQVLDKMANLKVLVIGDTILDEYQYCQAIGMSSKDPALAIHYKSHELFAGGVLAVANHVANFTESVDLVAPIGEKDSHEEFIREQLHPKIKAKLLTQPEAPTLLKRRFIDGYSFNKLFEVYVMDDSGLPNTMVDELCQWLEDKIANYDLVIAADFGHGFINAKIKQTLAEQAKFLAVNTQSNAGNRGFNTISQYSRADFVSIADHELRLDSRKLQGEARPQMETLIKKIGATRLIVTQGRKGCTVLSGDGECVEIPAFADRTVDRVGSGDAFFAVTALAAALGEPNEILGLIGNVVGALAVQVIGNKKPIDKLSVQKSLVSLMK